MVFRRRGLARIAGLLIVMGIGMEKNSFAEVTPVVAKIKERQASLGINLLKLAKDTPNSVVSPYSVSSGLMLARLGAVGEAAAALDESLGTAEVAQSGGAMEAFRDLNAQVLDSDKGVTLTLANSIWITDRGAFKEVFEKRASEYLSASAWRVSFTDPELARKQVNGWVSERTQGKIAELVTPGTFTPESVAALVNALHFKAPWRTQFSVDSTVTDTFTAKPGVTKQVPMMWSMERYKYVEDANWQVVNLPFEGDHYGFLLLVPKRELQQEQVREALSSDLLVKVLQSTTQARVSLRMPRFTIRHSRELSKDLSQLGLGVLFSPKADFSEITSLPLKIGSIQHEAYLEVAEHGVEAAAATAVTFAKSSAPYGQEEMKEVNANHPFAFAIVHNATQAALFLGLVGDPS